MNDKDFDILKIIDDLKQSIEHVKLNNMKHSSSSDVLEYVITSRDSKINKSKYSQNELFSLFQKQIRPHIHTYLLNDDTLRNTQAEQVNDPDALQASMSFDFTHDLKFLLRTYLEQLNFAYHIKFNKSLFVVSKTSEEFMAPLSMIFFANNLLAFYSFRMLPTLQEGIVHAYNVLRAQGYCSDAEKDPNAPNFTIGIKQHDISFNLSCTNNFLDIDAPIGIKQELYFKIVSDFALNLVKSIEFNFTEIDKSSEHDYLDIYPSFVETKMLFLKHLTENFFTNLNK